MRKDILDILRCIRCDSRKFTVQQEARNDTEIRSGVLVCDNCKALYPIEDGILNLLSDANEPALVERKAMDSDEYISDEDGRKYKIDKGTIERFKDKFLLLPEGDESPIFKRGGSFQTIQEASDRFYDTFDSLNIKGNERVLEIGACFGYASRKFAEKGCKVTAIDISNYLKAADVFIGESYIDRVFCDMHNLPFAENTFDIVFGAAVLHHSKDLANVFGQIRRVLCQSGKLVLINESARGRFEKVHYSFSQMQEKGFQDTSYTIPEWKQPARKAGFKKVKIEFLSLAGDYITRHKNRGTKDNFKIKVAYFLKKHKIVEAVLLSFLIVPRILFRPKSWRMICYK